MWTPFAHFCDRSILITGSAISPAETLRIRVGKVNGAKKSRQTSSIGMIARAPYCAMSMKTVFISLRRAMNGCGLGGNISDRTCLVRGFVVAIEWCHLTFGERREHLAKETC